MLKIKLIIAAVIALTVIGIAAYIGIQAKRIDLLKAENTALRVSLESAESVLKNQSEQITSMNTQLTANDEICRKQLNARNTAKNILITPPKKQSEAAHSLLRASAEPAQEHIKPLDVIDHEKNTVAVAYLNELFGVRTADGL